MRSYSCLTANERCICCDESIKNGIFAILTRIQADESDEVILKALYLYCMITRLQWTFHSLEN